MKEGTSSPGPSLQELLQVVAHVEQGTANASLSTPTVTYTSSGLKVLCIPIPFLEAETTRQAKTDPKILRIQASLIRGNEMPFHIRLAALQPAQDVAYT
ncbi:hypothetical protein AMTR_s00051p00124290 [Amborella trichopoda]|uniref:Uncharacterized protein n=1 Tax=Amborella trichopoda TaxID=13333 RepID=U5D2K0_AMBTC|nr:hypothetical protein AMTR_s00051p00124290 [Amborella trichopoda]